jgi:hypothetical protein
MEDPKASYAVRAYCADKVIDRAYGKAPQQTNLQITAQTRRAADLTDDELAAIIARASPPLIETQAAPVAEEGGRPGELPSDQADGAGA